MPDGQPAPVSHQHADDTTIHVLQPSDAQVALDSSIALFCAATCSQLNVSKSRGFLVQAQPLASASVAALPSIGFITGQQTIIHPRMSLPTPNPSTNHPPPLTYGCQDCKSMTVQKRMSKHLDASSRQGRDGLRDSYEAPHVKLRP